MDHNEDEELYCDISKFLEHYYEVKQKKEITLYRYTVRNGSEGDYYQSIWASDSLEEYSKHLSSDRKIIKTETKTIEVEDE